MKLAEATSTHYARHYDAPPGAVCAALGAVLTGPSYRKTVMSPGDRMATFKTRLGFASSGHRWIAWANNDGDGTELILTATRTRRQATYTPNRANRIGPRILDGVAAALPRSGAGAAPYTVSTTE